MLWTLIFIAGGLVFLLIALRAICHILGLLEGGAKSLSDGMKNATERIEKHEANRRMMDAMAGKPPKARDVIPQRNWTILMLAFIGAIIAIYCSLAWAGQDYASMLPDLRRPVYLMVGSPICDEIDELEGPLAVTVPAGECILTPTRLAVVVIKPAATSYGVLLRHYKAINVVLRGNDQSDATPYGGLTFLRCLTNKRTIARCPVT